VCCRRHWLKQQQIPQLQQRQELLLLQLQLQQRQRQQQSRFSWPNTLTQSVRHNGPCPRHAPTSLVGVNLCSLVHFSCVAPLHGLYLANEQFVSVQFTLQNVQNELSPVQFSSVHFRRYVVD